ncbi:fused MFS/spermidine synthase [Rhizocola hellebori]|uniref:fused MFS/spermidine synthase n=1 Tax=Rhizocola hellebori TaxID=1392758 RepID=UPI001941BDB4|nr:fused MFS/spermidine synthase [Rhizocola hellebori]
MAHPLPGKLAAFLVFFASGAVLVLETVALRLVGPYVGVSLQVTSSVIGVALAAIAYGAWFGGWLADRFDPRRLVAGALVLAGIATAVTLPLVRLAGEALRGGAVPGILLLTMITIFVPALVLSAVPPMVVKLQLADLRRTGEVVGRLSSIGTLGAVTATLATGFVLVAALPSSVIMVGLAVSLAVAGVGVAVYLRQAPKTKVVAALAVLGVAGAALSVLAPNPCDVETAYHCAAVRVDPANPSGRVLFLNAAEHSYVDLKDPSHLQFAYTQWIGAVADLVKPRGERIDALHLGGGGFTVPRYVTATRPGSDNVVFEIDDRLIDLGERELAVREGPDLKAVAGDARMLIGGRADASADLVVGDAFGDLAVPWHLATKEMAQEIARVLRPNGIYAQNVIDYPPSRFIRAEVATVAAVFPHVALIAPPAAVDGKVGANFIIVASQQPLPLVALAEHLSDSSDEAVVVVFGAGLTDFIGGMQVLTDDFAPVDQLLILP